MYNLNKYVNNKDLNIDFEFLSERIIDCNLSGCIHHPVYLPLIETYEKLFNIRKNDMAFKFGAGAQFIVSKRKILQRPKEFYLKIVKMLDNNINPIEGFVIERFHKLIFTHLNREAVVRSKRFKSKPITQFKIYHYR
jgi:hypothetical protein